MEKEEAFDFHSDNIVIFRPGGKLSDIRELVKTKVDSIMRIHKLITIWIFLAGGICNLTSKLTQSGDTEIQYIRSDQNVQSVNLQFRDFFNYFQSICYNSMYSMCLHRKVFTIQYFKRESLLFHFYTRRKANATKILRGRC